MEESAGVSVEEKIVRELDRVLAFQTQRAPTTASKACKKQNSTMNMFFSKVLTTAAASSSLSQPPPSTNPSTSSTLSNSGNLPFLPSFLSPRSPIAPSSLSASVSPSSSSSSSNQTTTGPLSEGFWPRIFHGLYVATKEIIPPSRIQQYLRLVEGYLAELNSGKATSEPPSSSFRHSVHPNGLSGSNNNTKDSSTSFELRAAKVFRSFLQSHKLDAVNSIIGLRPSESVILNHLPKEAQSKLLSTFSTNALPTAPAINLGGIPTSFSGSGRSLPARITTNDLIVTEAMTTRDGLWDQMSTWTKIEDAELVKQKVREFVLAVEEFEKKVKKEKEEKLKEKDLSTFVEGDIVVVRLEGGLLQYGRFVELFGFATGANMAMIHLSPYESPGIGIEVNRVLAKFPSSLESLLYGQGTLKRLIDSPVDEFYFSSLSRVKYLFNSYLASSDVEDVELLFSVNPTSQDNNIKLTDEAIYIELRTQFQRLFFCDSKGRPFPIKDEIRLPSDLEKTCLEMDKSCKEKLKNLRRTCTHATFQEDLKPTSPVSTFSVKQRLQSLILEYRGKIQSVLAAISGEKESLLNGTRKSILAEWWLKNIQQQVVAFLEERGYDYSAVPTDYIEQPPKNIWAVRNNLAIVKRWLKPQFLDDLSDVTQLIKSVVDVVYPKLDSFVENAEVVISEWLKQNFNQKLQSTDLGEKFAEVVKLLNESPKFTNLSEPLQGVKMRMRSLAEDCLYVFEMKELEAEAEQNFAGALSGGAMPRSFKLSLARAVPIGGLVLGSFVRLENELNTVMELWSNHQRKPRNEPVPGPSPSSNTKGDLNTRGSLTSSDTSSDRTPKSLPEINNGKVLSSSDSTSTKASSSNDSVRIVATANKGSSSATLCIHLSPPHSSPSSPEISPSTSPLLPRAPASSSPPLSPSFASSLASTSSSSVIPSKPDRTKSAEALLTPTNSKLLKSQSLSFRKRRSNSPTPRDDVELQGNLLFFFSSPALCRLREGLFTLQDAIETIEAQPKVVYATDEENQTILHLVISHNSSQSIDIVKLLLDKGANINHQDKQQWTPLHCACKLSHITMCNLLLNLGADSSIQTCDGVPPLFFLLKTDLNSVDESSSEEETHSYLQLVSRLLHLNPTHYQQKTHAQDTVFHYVIMSPKPRTRLIRFLATLETYDCPINFRNCRGFSPLHLAVVVGCLENIKELLSVGADPLTLGPSHSRVMTLSNKPEVVELLQGLVEKWSTKSNIKTFQM